MNYNGKLVLTGIFLLSLVCGLAGCTSDAKTATNTTSNTTTTNKTTVTENKAAADNKSTTTTTTTTTTTASADAIGVAECDDFIKKYDACITGKVPEAARASYKSGIDQWRASWKKLAENPQTKSTLADVCKKSLETTKQSLSTYNCEW
jgi:hypothetical protein